MSNELWGQICLDGALGKSTVLAIKKYDMRDNFLSASDPRHLAGSIDVPNKRTPSDQGSEPNPMPPAQIESIQQKWLMYSLRLSATSRMGAESIDGLYSKCRTRGMETPWCSSKMARLMWLEVGGTKSPRPWSHLYGNHMTSQHHERWQM
jgi:hypothetical protein